MPCADMQLTYRSQHAPFKIAQGLQAEVITEPCHSPKEVLGIDI